MLKVVVRVVLTFALIGWLVTQVDLSSVAAIVAQARPGWLVLAALINLLALLCVTWRWQVLLAGMGVRLGFPLLLRTVLVGTFFSMFLPSSIGGDVMKMVLIAADTHKREVAISSVLMDRVIGMAITILVGLLAVLFLPAVWGNQLVIGTLAAVLAIFCVGVTALFSRTLMRLIARLTPALIWRRVGDKALKIHDTLVGLRRQPDVLLGAATISALRQVAICGSVFCAAQSFGVGGGLVAYFAMVPISMAITALPIAINGLGLQDNALILLLSTVGVTAAQALTLSLFIHLMRNLTGLAGGLVFAVGRKRQAEAAPEVPPAPAPVNTDEAAPHDREHLQPVRQ